MTVLAWQRGGVAGGRPVVLVHGWGTGANRDFGLTGWGDRLGDAGFEVFACDLPGHADSGDVPVPADREPASWSADLVVADLERFRVPSCTVVGHGHGGLVAAHLAVRDAARFRPLVLVGCDDRVGLPGGDLLVAALRDRSTRIWDATVAEVVGDVRSDRRHDLETLATWAEHATWPAPARLGALRTPVLLAVGTEDDHRRGAPRLARLFHDARLATVAGTARALVGAAELPGMVADFVLEQESPDGR